MSETEIVEEKVEEKKEPPRQIEVSIGSSGELDFANQTQLAQSARLLIKMRLAPNHLIEEGIEAVMSALLLCKRRNLPESAMNEMAYVKGKLTCFGTLFSALAERHPKYGEKEEFFLTKEGDRICTDNKNLATGIPWACVIKIKKLGGTIWNEYFFSVDDAKQAKLLTENTKPDSGWIKYTKDLLFHKTKSRALKANYASALEGIEYYEDLKYAPEEKHVSEELNKIFGEKNAEEMI